MLCLKKTVKIFALCAIQCMLAIVVFFCYFWLRLSLSTTFLCPTSALFNSNARPELWVVFLRFVQTDTSHVFYFCYTDPRMLGATVTTNLSFVCYAIESHTSSTDIRSTNSSDDYASLGVTYSLQADSEYAYIPSASLSASDSDSQCGEDVYGAPIDDTASDDPELPLSSPKLDDATSSLYQSGSKISPQDGRGILDGVSDSSKLPTSSPQLGNAASSLYQRGSTISPRTGSDGPDIYAGFDQEDAASSNILESLRRQLEVANDEVSTLRSVVKRRDTEIAALHEKLRELEGRNLRE